jgi:phage-related protein (TIGR01555 family)
MLDFLAMPRKRIAKPTTSASVQPRSYRLDGWQNVLTGLGTSRDKSTYAEVIPTVLTQQQCEDLWKGDDMADLIVTALPGESLREDPTLTIASIEDADERAAAVDTVMAALSDLKVKQAIRRGLEYERAYGGAAIYVGAVDGQDPAEPLQLSSLRAIRHLTVFERRQLTAVSYQENPLLPDYGKPWLYEVQSFSGVGTGQRVHASRLVVFPGRRVTDRNPTANDGWGESVLSLVWDVLRIFNQAFSGVGYTMLDFSVAIMKIKGLASILAANSPEAVANRAQAVELGRSIAKTILLDSEEEYERKTTNLSGVSDVLSQVSTRLAAAARMPISKLFGQSASGLNATGEGDARNWYDAVKAYQADSVRPAYERMLRLIFAAKAGPTKGLEPDNWALKFPALWQPTAKEQAETRKIVAETDAINYDMGLVTSAELRNARFGGEEYSAETEIDDTLDPAQTAALAGQAEKDPTYAAALAPTS